MKTTINYKHLAIVAAAAVLPLLPFLDKAFHIDDPLFLWTAKQILAEPHDFLGFSANWFDYHSPATVFITNPPLASYYQALVSLFAGFSERALHFAFLLPAALTTTGTYVLASRFTTKPLGAALAVVAMPAFMVSSTMLMCDVMMLSFWVWAMVFWIGGVDEKRPAYLAAGAFLIGAAALTKYFGVSLVLLLGAYSILKGRAGLKTLPYLLIPVALLAGYHFYTEYMYGRSHLLGTTSFAVQMESREETGLFIKTFIGWVFAGGCLISAFLIMPFIWGLRALIPAVLAAALSAIFLYWRGRIGDIYLFGPGFGWGYVAQLSALSAAGLSLAGLVVYDIAKRRDVQSVLLAMWIAGTFVFAIRLNWTINAKILLPMAPAFAILAMRAAEGANASKLRLCIPVALSFLLSFTLAWSDYAHAESARSRAFEISKKYADAQRTLWFQGHWGFQYYMEGLGAKPYDFEGRIRPGEMVVVPHNNTGKRRLPETYYLIDEIRVKPVLINVMNLTCGAGFYSSLWGPLPFVFHPGCAEGYRVYMKAAP